MPSKRRRAASKPATGEEASPPPVDVENESSDPPKNGLPTPTDSSLVPPDAHISPNASISYWSSTPSTVSGMLGGYPQVSRIDIAGSRAFLAKLRRLSLPPDMSKPLPQPPAKLRLVADCGAGIGRITTNFLVTVAEHVDVVEPVAKFTDQLRLEHRELVEAKNDHDQPAISNIFNSPLESWTPPPDRLYDVIWNQWCLGHLPDKPLVRYLHRLDSHLPDGGFIVVKENISTDVFGEDVYDEVDSSVTRSQKKFENIFDEAGLLIRKTEVQRGGFGKGLGLMPVRMWGLQPRRWYDKGSGVTEVSEVMESG